MEFLSIGWCKHSFSYLNHICLQHVPDLFPCNKPCISSADWLPFFPFSSLRNCQVRPYTTFLQRSPPHRWQYKPIISLSYRCLLQQFVSFRCKYFPSVISIETLLWCCIMQITCQREHHARIVITGYIISKICNAVVDKSTTDFFSSFFEWGLNI